VITRTFLDSVKRHLEYNNNHQEYLLWLYTVTEIWAEQGTSLYNQLYLAGNMPSKKEFYADPKIMLRSVLDQSLSTYQVHSQEKPGASFKFFNTVLSIVQVSDTAKFIEKKALLWLPNEAYIAARLKDKQPKKTSRMLQHAYIETTRPMWFFNQGIRLISILSILFFLLVSVDGLIQLNLTAFTVSLIALMGAGTLFWHVNSILKPVSSL